MTPGRWTDEQTACVARLEANYGQAKVMPLGRQRTSVCKRLAVLTGVRNIILDCGDVWAMVAPNGNVKTERKEVTA